MKAGGTLLKTRQVGSTWRWYRGSTRWVCLTSFAVHYELCCSIVAQHRVTLPAWAQPSPCSPWSCLSSWRPVVGIRGSVPRVWEVIALHMSPNITEGFCFPVWPRSGLGPRRLPMTSPQTTLASRYPPSSEFRQRFPSCIVPHWSS